MGLTQKLGTIPLAIQTDSSNNVGIGGAAIASYKLAVTGASLFSSSVFLGSNANSADNSLLTIKQASTAYNNGIYLERGGERNGYFMYVGGALDALTFRRNYFGTQSDVMSLTRDGNVGIGTSSPGAKLDVQGHINVTSAAINFSGSGSALTTDPAIYRIGGLNDLAFAIGSTERMRITSGGQISQTAPLADWSYVMTNSNASSPNGILIQYTGANKNNTTNQFIYCTDNFGGDLRFAVRSNGGIANFQANNVNLSDERTKKDIIPLESYWDKFKAIEIVKFKYKDQTHDDFNIGVIAQQVEKVAPEFIDVEGWDTKLEFDEQGNEIISEEEPLKSVYTADLHHATIKVLQEAMAKIEELEAKVTALENK